MSNARGQPSLDGDSPGGRARAKAAQQLTLNAKAAKAAKKRTGAGPRPRRPTLDRARCGRDARFPASRPAHRSRGAGDRASRPRRSDRARYHARARRRESHGGGRASAQTPGGRSTRRRAGCRGRASPDFPLSRHRLAPRSPRSRAATTRGEPPGRRPANGRDRSTRGAPAPRASLRSRLAPRRRWFFPRHPFRHRRRYPAGQRRVVAGGSLLVSSWLVRVAGSRVS